MVNLSEGVPKKKPLHLTNDLPKRACWAVHFDVMPCIGLSCQGSSTYFTQEAPCQPNKTKLVTNPDPAVFGGRGLAEMLDLASLRQHIRELRIQTDCSDGVKGFNHEDVGARWAPRIIWRRSMMRPVQCRQHFCRMIGSYPLIFQHL